MSRACIDCGVDIADCNPHTPRCDVCRPIFKTARQTEWARQKHDTLPTLVCKKCGVIVDRIDTFQRYCLDCSPYSTKKTLPTCSDCGSSDVSRKGSRCEKCSKARKATKRRERNPPKPPRFIECGRCGKTIQAKAGNQKWCADCGRAINLEKLKAKYWADPATHAEGVRQWFNNRIATDSEFRAKEFAARYARKRKLADADSETVEYMAILRDDPCSYCGLSSPSQIDHIYPTSLGGAHHWLNMTAACGSCNASKKVRTDLLIWMLERKELRSTRLVV
jgi:hypothetical protein